MDPIQVEELTVESDVRKAKLRTVGFYRRREFGIGQFRDREYFDARPAVSSQLSMALRGLPGIRIVPKPGRGFEVHTSRGGWGGCPSQIFLDGVRIPSAMPNAQRQVGIDIDNLIRASDVEAVEWYAGPSEVPPQFRVSVSDGMRPDCGVLLIWSRSGS